MSREHAETNVTLVVVPRERFSAAVDSLDSVFAATEFPFDLVYVDAGSPRRIAAQLRKRVEARGFSYIRIDAYLSPNAARNVGLTRVETPYVVFLDNDVYFRDGWLAPLVDCAEAKNATLVTPVLCQNEPLHTEIHCFGGVTHIAVDDDGRRVLRDHAGNQGEPLARLAELEEPIEVETVEYHAVLARTAFFREHGALDEGLPAYHDHADLSLCVRAKGGTVYLAPDSVVTYVPPASFTLSDARYFLLRWSDAWIAKSIERMEQKWQLDRTDEAQARLEGNGWKRRQLVLRGFARRVPAGALKEAIKRLAFRLDSWLGRSAWAGADASRWRRRPDAD